MLTINLSLTFSMIWEIALANLLASGLLLLFSRQIHKLAFVPGHLIVPGIMVVLLMGAWIATNSMGDWWTCLAMGVLGYWMKQGGWPRPPLILALVLGGLMENNFQLSTQIYNGYEWLYNRPLVLAVEVLIAVTVFLGVRGYIKPQSNTSSEAGEGAMHNPLVSLPLSVVLAVVFLVALRITAGFEEAATAQFPNAILIFAIPAIAFVLFQDVVACSKARVATDVPTALVSAIRKADLPASALFLAYLLATFALTYLAGQYAALALFVAVYLGTWGQYRWPVYVGYAAAVVVVIWGFYGQLMQLLLHSSLLFG